MSDKEEEEEEYSDANSENDYTGGKYFDSKEYHTTFNGEKYAKVIRYGEKYRCTDYDGDVMCYDKDGNEYCIVCHSDDSGDYKCSVCDKYRCWFCSEEICDECNMRSCCPDEAYCWCWPRCESCENVFKSQSENIKCKKCDERLCGVCGYCNECSIHSDDEELVDSDGEIVDINSVGYNLKQWKQYLSPDDFNYLVEYIDTALDPDKKNDKLLIISGDPATGKSELIHDITSLVGTNKIYNTYGTEFIYQPILPLIYIQDIGEMQQKKKIQLYSNLIDYGQAIISDMISTKKVHKLLLDKSYVIEMTHKFI